MTPEKELLCAVIKQAIDDSKYVGFDKQKTIKQDAIEFLNTSRITDFIEFWHLDLNPEVISKMAKEE